MTQENETTFPSVRVVGMHFREREGIPAKEWASLVEPGTLVKLVREPDNAFDPYAIKVIANSMHVGYIEAAQAMWIAPELDDRTTDGEIDDDLYLAKVSGKIEATSNTYPLVDVTVS